MKIKAKFNFFSYILLFLIVLVSTISSYLYLELAYLQQFNFISILLWAIFGGILGIIIATLVNIRASRQYFLLQSDNLIYQGLYSKREMKVLDIKSIKFEFENKSLVEINSADSKIAVLISSFQRQQLCQFLNSLTKINSNIEIDEYTKAILEDNSDSWLLKEEPIMKLIRHGRLIFGFFLLIGLVIYIVDEIYKFLH